MRDVCQMFVFALSQQMDPFHLDINEHVLFLSFPPLPHLNGRCWKNNLCSQTFLPSFSLLNLCLWLFLLMSTAAEQSLLFAAPASEANLRNEPITLSVLCVCWIIEVNGAFLFIFLSVNYVHERERCSNSQLWKLYFRWVYVVIISSSHVTGCMCVCVCVRARLWAGVCLCLHDSRPGTEVTQETAEGWERQTLHRCRGGERERERKGKGQENHRQIKEYDRNKETNERSLTAGSSPRLCCWIHRKQIQTCSKTESVSVWAGQVRIWLWNVFTLRSL